MEFFLPTPLPLQTVWRPVLFSSTLKHTWHPLAPSHCPSILLQIPFFHWGLFICSTINIYWTSALCLAVCWALEKQRLRTTRCHCPGFFHKSCHISLSKCFQLSQASPSSLASRSIFSFTQDQGTRLGVFLWILQNRQHPGWLKHSRGQPWPRGSLRVCSDKPHPWLTLTSSPKSSGSYENSLLTIHLSHSLALQTAGSPKTVGAHRHAFPLTQPPHPTPRSSGASEVCLTSPKEGFITAVFLLWADLPLVTLNHYHCHPLLPPSFPPCVSSPRVFHSNTDLYIDTVNQQNPSSSQS